MDSRLWGVSQGTPPPGGSKWAILSQNRLKMTPPGGVPPPGGVKNGSILSQNWPFLSQNMVILSQNRLKNDPPGGVKIDPLGGVKMSHQGGTLGCDIFGVFSHCNFRLNLAILTPSAIFGGSPGPPSLGGGTPP